MAETIIFDKNDSMRLKGVAIILMICNHLFPIHEWIYPENQFYSIAVGGKTLAAYFGGFSKICVAIFALLTGMAMCYTYSKNTIGGGYRHTLKKLLPFYLTYWLIIALLYIPVMLACGLFDFSPVEFFFNLLGYETTVIKIAWYVRFYLELVISFPLIILLDKLLGLKIKNANVIGIIMVLFCWAASILSNLFYYPMQKFVTEYFEYLAIPVVGYYIAKGSLFEKAAKVISDKKMNFWIEIIIGIVIFAVLFLARGIAKDIMYFKLDVIYAPIFVFVLFYLWNELPAKIGRIIDRLLFVMGQYSLEIWFMHGIFFIGNATVQKVAYWPKYSILILAWVIVLLLPLAILFQKIKQMLIGWLRIK